MTDYIEARETKRAVKLRARRAVIFIAVIMIVVIAVKTKSVLADGIDSFKNGRSNSIFNQKGGFLEPSESRIDIESVNMKIRDLGELTTAELTSDGVLRYEKGKIPIITKHGFLMTYSSTVRAGIDFSRVKAKVQGHRVKITIPKAEIQTLNIDPESITIYDESHCIIKGNEKEQMKECIVKAEEDAMTNLDKDALLKRADDRAESMIRELLSEVIGDVEVDVTRE